MNGPPPALRAVRVTKRFRGRAIIDDVDLTLPDGQCAVLLGANGAGKTTLLRCLAGAMRPTSGEVWWRGRRAAGRPALRRYVGLAAHESGLYTHLTLRENLIFAARMLGLADPAAVADRALRRVGLRRAAERFPHELSRGMRQKAAVARATLHDPPLILLDEPCAHLDAASADWLAGMLAQRKAAGAAICVATHDAGYLKHPADRVWHLEKGCLHAGRPTRGSSLPARGPSTRPVECGATA